MLDGFSIELTTASAKRLTIRDTTWASRRSFGGDQLRNSCKRSGGTLVRNESRISNSVNPSRAIAGRGGANPATECGAERVICREPSKFSP